MSRPEDTGPEYAVPALDKALDVLEVLASTERGMTQLEIATAVGRSVSHIFRVLGRLERRGWIYRESGVYTISLRMFELAHRHPPLNALSRVALGPMRELAALTRQSCNLSVLDAGVVRVIAQVESPADFGFRVRVGADFSAESTAAGVALRGSPSAGVCRLDDVLQPGITDLAAAITTISGVVAALTVPYVATTFSEVGVATVIRALERTADAVSGRLRGEVHPSTQ